MTPREEIIATYRFEKTETIPYLISFEEEMINKLNEYYKSDAWQERVVGRYFFWTGGAEIDAGEYLGNGLVKDHFGATIKMGNIPHAVKPALEMPSLKGYRWPDIEELVDRKKISERLNGPLVQSRFVYAGLPFGYFERGMYIRGAESFLMDMIDNPDFILEYTERYMNLKLQYYDLINELGYYDAAFGGGDDCDQRGCIMGVDLWRKFIKPCLTKEIEHVHKLGKYFYMHSCGNVMPIIDDLVEMGIDSLEPIQPEPMDIFALKDKLKGKVVMVGGMGAQSTLPFGTPNEVRKKTRMLLRKLGEGGGYIIGNAKPMFGDTPVENAVAFIEESLQGQSVL